MSRFLSGTVTEIISERRGLQRLKVGNRLAYVLTQLVGEVAVGDEVVLNVTATDLALGTGGWDIVHWNLSRRDLDQKGDGHIIKLRYTSLQADVGAHAEHAETDVGLDGLPVVAGFLHSQLAPAAVAFTKTRPGARLGYVMTDSAALPFALSDLAAGLAERGHLHTTVCVGQAFGADIEAVNLLDGLAAARAEGCDAVIVAPGPGVVGTATRFGFSGIEVVSIVNLVAAVKARPIVAVRWSGGDKRARHRGVSHHVSTALSLMQASAWVASTPDYELGELPGHHERAIVDVPDLTDALAGLPATTMGRGPHEDLGFFEMAAAAGVVAAEMIDS